MNAQIAERWKTQTTAHEAGQNRLTVLEERRAPGTSSQPQIDGARQVLQHPARQEIHGDAKAAGGPAPATVTARAG